MFEYRSGKRKTKQLDEKKPYMSKDTRNIHNWKEKKLNSWTKNIYQGIYTKYPYLSRETLNGWMKNIK